MRTLAIALMFVALGALAQAPQGQRGASKPTTEASDSQGFSKDRPAFIKILPPDASPKENEQRAKEDQERAEKLRVDQGMLQYTGQLARDGRRTLIATICMFFVTAGLFAVAAFQFIDARKAVNAAIKSAGAAEAAVKIAESTAERQLRAYVMPTHMNAINDGVNVPLKFKIQFANSGQTPAYDVATHSHVFVGPPGTAIPEVQIPVPPVSKSFLAPGESSYLTPSASNTLSAEVMQQVQDGRLLLLIAGRIEYRDAFNHDRWTNFRAIYLRESDKTVGLTAHREGNDAN